MEIGRILKELDAVVRLSLMCDIANDDDGVQ